MAFLALEKLHQLYDGYRRVFRIAGREWVLLQEEGKLYCVANQCPHQQAPLNTASVQAQWIRCPLHGLVFDLRTGLCVQPSHCASTLSFLPLIYEANQVGVDV